MGFSVPPRLRLERWALTPPFHPYPGRCRPWRYVLCGTFRRDASRRHLPRVSAGLTTGGYAASRPVVFGLSSPGLRQERFPTLPKSKTCPKLGLPPLIARNLNPRAKSASSLNSKHSRPAAPRTGLGCAAEPSGNEPDAWPGRFSLHLGNTAVNPGSHLDLRTLDFAPQ